MISDEAKENPKESSCYAEWHYRKLQERLRRESDFRRESDYRGWQCPICERVYAPSITMCKWCER